MNHPQARLLILTKAPVPGQVKTRLIPLLGAQGAADFYTRLIHRCLDTATRSGLCPIELWCSPSRDAPFFKACRERYDVELHEQSRGGLGRRMHLALECALTRGTSAILIGADCPSLGGADLDESLTALSQGVEVVLGPARDGGYYLVGMKRANPQLFANIRWGTPEVFSTTVKRLDQQGIHYHCLSERADVDTPKDYQRLLESRRFLVMN